MCPRCFGDFAYWDDYCFYYCPYSYECEDEYEYFMWLRWVNREV